MRNVAFPTAETGRALALLLSGERFEVIAEARSPEDRFAAFVLGRFGWSWGHFYRAAFCSLSPPSGNQVFLTITYLDVQRQWHGRNLFRASDQGIEDDIAAYALASINGAQTAREGK
jgi:hypothetical protein